MSTADLSFYRLFHRSRDYRGPAADDDSSEGKASREQRERFAVAALAFCLKHDLEFRRLFWEKICRVPDDPPEMPPIGDDDICLEPPRWADLRLISDTPSLGRYVWVIEVKAGAKLAAIQNPTKKEFHSKGLGYGALFSESESPKRTRMRYIVLGVDEVLYLPAKHAALPIWLRQRSWSHVHDCKTSKLVLDLFESLGVLNIHPFAMNNAKSISVGRGLAGVGEAHDVLMAIYTWLGVKPGQRKFDVYPENGGSVAGIFIGQPASIKPAPAHLQLRKLSGSGAILAWVGYFASPDDKVERSVWLYFINSKARDRMLDRLKVRFPQAQAESDGVYLCVSVEALDIAEKDLIWFHAVFKEAGVSAAL